jgi:hypothetical protein
MFISTIVTLGLLVLNDRRDDRRYKNKKVNILKSTNMHHIERKVCGNSKSLFGVRMYSGAENGEQ